MSFSLMAKIWNLIPAIQNLETNFLCGALIMAVIAHPNQ